MPISPKVFHRFSKTLLHLKHVESGHFRWKFQVRRYFSFAMKRWKLSPSTRLEIFHFQPVNCSSKDSISLKVFKRFSKILLHLMRVESGHLGRKFEVRSYFIFAIARWKLSPSTSFEIFHFQHVSRTSKNPIFPKVFNRYSKTCFIWNVLNVGIWAENFRCAGIFLFQWQGENLAHRKDLKISKFQPVNCPSKKSYICKCI